jgi:hypothetical protein
MRLVPGAPGLPTAGAAAPLFRAVPEGANADAEIRLTYRELSALIEDAIRSLK